MKAFKDLTPEERAEIVEYLAEYKFLEVVSSGGWVTSNSIYPEFIYRIPVTKPSVNWDHLRDDIIAIVKTKTGRGVGFTFMPVIDKQTEFWDIRSGMGYAIDCVSSFDPGTCDWEDSLVIRPGVEQ